MTMESCCSKLPRPWYVSVTILWHELINFPALRLAVEPFLETIRLPGHHVAFPYEFWHSTVFEVLRINWTPPEHRAFADFARLLFTHLTNQRDFTDNLARKLNSLTLKAQQVRCFDNGTTVQFEESKDLKKIRIGLQDFFRGRTAELVDSTISMYRRFANAKIRPIVETRVDSSPKNSSQSLYGSFARSPCRGDSDVLRWEEEIGPVDLQCHGFHLLVSDEALTNHMHPSQNDLSFHVHPTD